MSVLSSPLYASALFQNIAGGAWRPGGTALTRRALALCGFPPGADVLDIGCGQGASLALLRNLGLNGTGLDRECSLEQPFPFVQADAHEPPFPNASFDGMLCECVLSLLSDPGRALRNFAALLRPGGKLILSDLYLKDAPAAPASRASSSCLAGARPRRELERLLEESGFAPPYFEDHSSCLKELAARLLWYGDENLRQRLRAEGGCSCSARYGYGLWIAAPAPAMTPHND